ncbi:unnamed protein product [Lactuca virosa]|uniref:Uncharacterized protein n=1 Tax=Lactuca virosa TaxID=75947 RepID=A0AAU9LAP2_9ASTR|nr:unnamed protein product [Lactuca virosa]
MLQPVDVKFGIHPDLSTVSHQWRRTCRQTSDFDGFNLSVPVEVAVGLLLNLLHLGSIRALVGLKLIKHKKHVQTKTELKNSTTTLGSVYFHRPE